jgi:hypothetical protein
MFDLTEGLIRRGYSDTDIKSILGGNAVRVLGDIGRQKGHWRDRAITLINPAPDIRTRPLARTCHSQGRDVASTLAVSSFLGGGLLSVRPALYPREPGRCVARATFIGPPSHPALSSHQPIYPLPKPVPYAVVAQIP